MKVLAWVYSRFLLETSFFLVSGSVSLPISLPSALATLSFVPFWAETVAQLSRPARWYLKGCWLKRGGKTDPETHFWKWSSARLCDRSHHSSRPPFQHFSLEGCLAALVLLVDGLPQMPPVSQLELLEGRNCSWFHHPWKAWDLHSCPSFVCPRTAGEVPDTMLGKQEMHQSTSGCPHTAGSRGGAVAWFPGRMSSLGCVPKGHCEFILAGDSFF